MDEAQDFSHGLRELVFDVLSPAMTDYRGSICLLGTPGILASGLFYDISTGREPGWKLHQWSAFDNLAPSSKDPKKTCAQEWGERIEEMKRLKPGIELTPSFRRQYLREWVIENDKLVYRYEPVRNDYEQLPEYKAGSWHRVLAVDLGYTDASAFAQLAYHDNDNTLFVESIEKQEAMDVSAVSLKIKAYIRRAEPDYLICDGSNRMAVEEMRRRWDLPIHAADRTGKSDFIELLNGDFITGNVKLKRGTCTPLVEEYGSLIWDNRSTRRQEHPACENHAADAVLYGWRHCYSYLSVRPTVKPKYGSPEWQRVEEEAMEARGIERAEEEARQREEDWGYLN